MVDIARLAYFVDLDSFSESFLLLLLVASDLCEQVFLFVISVRVDVVNRLHDRVENVQRGMSVKGQSGPQFIICWNRMTELSSLDTFYLRTAFAFSLEEDEISHTGS